MFGTMDLLLECGNVKVMDEHNIIIGDLNWNGFPYEVGDLVLLANHIMDPGAYPFNLRQNIASDVNGDDIWASIADLIWMINYINGFNGGKVTPVDVSLPCPCLLTLPVMLTLWLLPKPVSVALQSPSTTPVSSLAPLWLKAGMLTTRTMVMS
jgi:hypothetical protein